VQGELGAQILGNSKSAKRGEKPPGAEFIESEVGFGKSLFPDITVREGENEAGDAVEVAEGTN